MLDLNRIGKSGTGGLLLMQWIEVGKAVELEVDREVEFGFFLTDGTDDVLLHNSEIIVEDTELEIGQKVTVFIYLDKQGRLTSTMKIPRYSNWYIWLGRGSQC